MPRLRWSLVMATVLLFGSGNLFAQAGAEDIVNGAVVGGGDAANVRTEATLAPWGGDGTTFITGSSGFVDDTADYYQIAVLRDGTLRLDLYDLSADLDLLLFDSLGNLLDRQGTAGPDAEFIGYTATAGESYVVGVVPYEGVSSGYVLSMISPSVDSDDDGVADLDDLCPNTPAGTVVDAVGCPLPFDSDGDGVPDADDQCPDTPTGTEVDADGCPLAPAADFSMEAFRADPRFGDLDGAGYTIVVVDTGIDLDHPSFGADADFDGVSDRIVYTQDFSNDGDGTVEDANGHGTYVASILGSSSPTDPGVAPGVNIVALQVIDNDGSGSGENLQRALQWVIDNHSSFNIVAVNMSLGSGSNSNTPSVDFLADELAVLADLGIVSVAPAGNSYWLYQTEGVDYPASDPNAIAVGATFFEDVGPVSWSDGAQASSSGADRLLPVSQRSELLTPIFAPVGEIAGLVTGGVEANLNTDGAAAYVSGLVALAQEFAEEQWGSRLTPAEFLNLLTQSADPIIDGDDEDDNVTNTEAGFLRINAVAFAEAISEFDPNGGGTPNTDNIPGDSSTQATLPIGSFVEGKLQFGGDTDWYRLELSAGVAYRLAMQGLTLEDPYLALYDSAGGLVQSNNDSGGTLNALIAFTPPTSGTFFLSAEAFSLSQTGSYIVEATYQQPEMSDSIAADASTGITLNVPTTFSSQVDFPGDEDWLKVAFNGGETYQIALNGQLNSDNPLGDPLLELYDANGLLLAMNDDGGPGLNALLNLTPPSSGTYFVNARAFGATATGVYLLEITGNPSPDNDIPDDVSTAAQLFVDQPFVNQIDFPGDRDLIRLSLEANALYTLWATGGESNPALDPQIQLFQQDGTLVAMDDDSGPGLSALLDLSMTESGIYYLRVQDGGIGAGEYTLVLEQLEDPLIVSTTLSSYRDATANTGDVIADSCTSGRASPELQEACNNLIEAAAGGDPALEDALNLEITPDKAVEWNIAVRQNNQVQNRNIGDRVVALRVGATGASFAGLTSTGPSLDAQHKAGPAKPTQIEEEIFNVNIVFDSMLGEVAFDQSTVVYDETGAMTGGQLIIEFLTPPLSRFGAFYVLDVATGYGRICLHYESQGCRPGENTLLETTGSLVSGIIKSDQRINTLTVGNGEQGEREQGTTASLKAWASSGLPVSFGSATPGACGVSGSVVSFLAPGTCTITADQAGDNHFNAAPQVTLNITVAKDNQLITHFQANPESGAVGASSSLSATASSGLPVSFGSSTLGVCSVAGSTVTYSALGTCTVTADQAGDQNYNAAPQETLNISVINRLPVANSDDYDATEDTQLSVTAPGVLGNDTDDDGDDLTAVLDTNVSHGMLNLSADGSFTYDPTPDYCGADSFTYHANDGTADSDTVTVSIDVACVNDLPRVTSVSPGAQTVDYSDDTATVTITVEDVDDTSTSLAESNEPPLSAGELSLTSTGCTVDTTPSPAEDGSTCTWSYGGQVLDPGDNVHEILFTASDSGKTDSGSGIETGTHTLTIQPEDATVMLDGDNDVSAEVDAPGGDSGPFSLFFAAYETDDPDHAHGASAEYGDLNTMVAYMTLIPVGPGSPLDGVCSAPNVAGSGYDQVATFECGFDDVPVNTYEVLAEIDGATGTTRYYSGFDEDVFTVFDPSLGFTSGGGWFYWPGTDDDELTACGPEGYSGDKTNFGFNLKYNKKKKTAKGSVLLMRHTVNEDCLDAGSYRVKSNAIEGMSLGEDEDANGAYGWAAAAGKSVFNEPGLEGEGNHPFLLYVEDHGEQGCDQDPVDTFWFEVKDKDGVVALQLNGPEPVTDGGDAEPIVCGNITVPHRSGKGSGDGGGSGPKEPKPNKPRKG